MHTKGLTFGSLITDKISKDRKGQYFKLGIVKGPLLRATLNCICIETTCI